MNIKQTLQVAIDAAESGRSGAVVEILKAIVDAMENLPEKIDFFVGQDKGLIIDTAQKIAFDKEEIKKRNLSLLNNKLG